MSASPTDLIHHPYLPPAGFAAPQAPVYKASTVFFPNVAALRARDWRQKRGYTYGLSGTPTTFVLEERIAALEGGRQCLLVPSGLAALSTVSLALLGTGDQVLIPDNAYGPLKVLAERELARWGIHAETYDPMQPADLASRLSSRTRLVWLEAPGSVTLEFPPVRQLSDLCRQRGIVTALDNTWGAGLAFNGFEGAGADIVVQALTKYPSGGGDVLMGSIVTRDDDLHLRLKATHMHLGWGVGGNDAEAVLRGLPSMHLRYRAQDATARSLARWLGRSAHVARVLHPALEGSPGHAHWVDLCGRDGLAACLFSAVFDERHAAARVDAFCDALRLFKIGYSWAGPVSLVVPYDLRSMRSPGMGGVREGGVLVRFAAGLERTEDLQADLEQALRVLD